jgi:6,7-dimethyl-8-ribityllumazine synthase
MPRTFEGLLTVTGARVAIVCARFNAFIVDSLVAGAVDALVRSGTRDEDITVFRAPGAFEMTQLAGHIVTTGRFDAVVCVGAVIRGGTPHFEHIATAVARGIAGVAERASIPVTFGVLTTDTIEQAIERAGTKAGNKGAEAAMAAVEMMSLYRTLRAAAADSEEPPA